MQKLTLKRRVSGIHAVHAPDGEPLGVLNLDDLDLDDGEFETVVRNHAAKKRSQAAGDELVRRVKDYAAGSGKTFAEAFKQVAAENPALAERHRSEVLSEL